ncbi:hypothetical protein D917_02703 [Trichinella nativa]|uniref:Uncharacterized protein n=4 Tax=Trichinella TaxID=6333 RepID=A0A1Y3ECA4_9BILA|nr:hypothetical protein D917_02703 [Trichinella nativa]
MGEVAIFNVENGGVSNRLLLTLNAVKLEQMSARGSASRCLGEIGTEFREAQRQVQNKKMKRNIKPGFFPLQQRDKQEKTMSNKQWRQK